MKKIQLTGELQQDDEQYIPQVKTPLSSHQKKTELGRRGRKRVTSRTE
jgi:hypothetical protein